MVVELAACIDIMPEVLNCAGLMQRERCRRSAAASSSAVSLAWRELSVTVSTKGQVRKVLHHLTGYAEPGRLLAIMGPSGSGKSTLLDSLAGRLARNATRGGSVWMNGQKQKSSFGTAAYVTQEDVLIGTLTVRETILYSAHLRLPDELPLAEKLEMVDKAILEMGLQNCADTPIGNWHLRGLSGGEKRRVSIALELLLRPHLLFLDEPTSGLDSASAFFVSKTLKKLARDGRTVIASIHQPSSEVYMLFDDLFLLANGKTVYFGPAQSAHEYFSAAGFPCPLLLNPSDHFLRAINSDFDRVKAVLRGSHADDDQADAHDPLSNVTTAQVAKVLVESYPLSAAALWAETKVEQIATMNGSVSGFNGSHASFWTQCLTLTCRSFKNMSRDIGYYWLRLAIYVMLTLCIGTVYYKVGWTYESINARASCMAYVAGFLTFMSIGGFPSFVEDMKVFSRERLNGHYGVTAFVIGNSISSLPFLLLICLVSGFICYYMVGLHSGFGHFIYFVLILFTSVAVVESLMMAVASVVPNFLMGIITGAGIQGLFMLTSGFFRLPNDIPKVFWRYPLSYLGFHMFSLQGMYQNDFSGVQFQNKLPGLPSIPGDLVLTEVYQVDMSRSKWQNFAVVFFMILLYRLFFFAMIKSSEEVVPRARLAAEKYWLRLSGSATQAVSRWRSCRTSASVAHRSSSDEYQLPGNLI